MDLQRWKSLPNPGIGVVEGPLIWPLARTKLLLRGDFCTEQGTLRFAAQSVL